MLGINKRMGNVIAWALVSDKYNGTCDRPWTCKANDDNDCQKHYNNKKGGTFLCKTEHHDNSCTDNSGCEYD